MLVSELLSLDYFAHNRIMWFCDSFSVFFFSININYVTWLNAHVCQYAACRQEAGKTSPLWANSYGQKDELCSHFTPLVLNLVSCISCSAFHWPGTFDRRSVYFRICVLLRNMWKWWNRWLADGALVFDVAHPRSKRLPQKHCFSQCSFIAVFDACKLAFPAACTAFSLSLF